MRTVSIRSADALRERLTTAHQVDASVAESSMPPYMESFLAHLRLLIGVPFDYLVPDPRLLPNESIRFFYVDRSWTDRLVDGAIAVGKIGTRGQAHHQAHGQNVQSQLDLTERVVRVLQRGITEGRPTDSAGIITGFLLRSAAVSGWPSMDVRAFREVLPAPAKAQDLANAEAKRLPLRLLRLELLSPSVLLALFDGIPKLVWCEEPHHGVQFGMTFKDGAYRLDRHGPTGVTEPNKPMVRVPMRVGSRRVVAVKALRQRLFALNDPGLVEQTGSAALAIELLNLPWRQRFEGTGGKGKHSGSFVPTFALTNASVRAGLATAMQEVL